ncbi:MAG: CpaF/VirB11 family protein [Actinomycetota bacterium]|nr:CpaF/VirB11 family protein [Actinomycetota bacterium]
MTPPTDAADINVGDGPLTPAAFEREPFEREPFEQGWDEVDEGLVRRIREKVARGLSERHAERERDGLDRINRRDEEQLAVSLINEQLREHAKDQLNQGRPPPSTADEAAVRKATVDLLFGLAALQPHLERADVINLHAEGGQPVWLDLVDGRTVRGAPIARHGDDLIEFVRELGRRVGISERRFDPDRYRINLQLPDGSRLFALGWVTREPHVFIRRHRYLDVGLGDLPATMSPLLETFLAAIVGARMNLLIAGGMADGKTTLLRALASEMDPGERIVTIESDYELALDRFPQRHREVVAMEAREANIEGVGQVTCAQLVRDAMRTSSQRVIVGEVLGDEVVPMLNAMNSGSKGSMCTLHANSSSEVFDKLALLAAQAPQRLDFPTTYALAANAVDFTIFVSRSAQGDRVVSSVREVAGFEEGRPLANELFAPNSEGHAVPTGVPVSDRRRRSLASAGFDPSWLSRSGEVR